MVAFSYICVYSAGITPDISPAHIPHEWAHPWCQGNMFGLFLGSNPCTAPVGPFSRKLSLIFGVFAELEFSVALINSVQALLQLYPI